MRARDHDTRTTNRPATSRPHHRAGIGRTPPRNSPGPVSMEGGYNMVRRRKTNILSFIGSHLLFCVLSVQVAFALAIVAFLRSWAPNTPESPTATGLLGAIAGCLILIAACTSVRGIRTQRRESDRSRAVSSLMETVLDTSREWLWAVDGHGNFTFSSKASATLLGFEPEDLIGRPVSTVIDQRELHGARQAVADVLRDDSSGWSGVTVSCRHRNGAPVWMEVSGRSRPTPNGQGLGWEGTSRPLPTHTVRTLIKKRIVERIDSTLQGGMILTAFQPINELTTGSVAGVEALPVFPATMAEARTIGSMKRRAWGLAGNLNLPPWKLHSARRPGCPNTFTSRSTSHPTHAWTPDCPTCLNDPAWPLTG